MHLPITIWIFHLSTPRKPLQVPYNYLLTRLVGVVLLKHIPKRSKLDWFTNDQQIHEVFDFHVQDSQG
jgi:hypothetical protein